MAEQVCGCRRHKRSTLPCPAPRRSNFLFNHRNDGHVRYAPSRFVLQSRPSACREDHFQSRDGYTKSCASFGNYRLDWLAPRYERWVFWRRQGHWHGMILHEARMQFFLSSSVRYRNPLRRSGERKSNGGVQSVFVGYVVTGSLFFNNIVEVTKVIKRRRHPVARGAKECLSLATVQLKGAHVRGP